MQQPKWENNLKNDRYMYKWITLLYTETNTTVNQLYLNIK